MFKSSGALIKMQNSDSVVLGWGRYSAFLPSSQVMQARDGILSSNGLEDPAETQERLRTNWKMQLS